MTESLYSETYVQNSTPKGSFEEGLSKFNLVVSNHPFLQHKRRIGTNLDLLTLGKLRIFFLGIGFIFSQVSLGQAQTLADQNFKTQGIDGYSATSKDIAGVRYTGCPSIDGFVAVDDAFVVSPNPAVSARRFDYSSSDNTLTIVTVI